MIAQAAFGRAERQVMLHAVAAENFAWSRHPVDRQRDGHGALGKFEALAVAVGNLQPVGDQVKLPARHLKSGVIINLHGGDYSTAFPVLHKRE